MLYLASNVPMALSAVYKESRFAADDVHPLYLTQVLMEGGCKHKRQGYDFRLPLITVCTHPCSG